MELTDKCNAACPQCPRNEQGDAVNPLLPLTELSLDDIKQIFKRDFILSLKSMFACGNFGDPAFAKDTLEIYEYFRSINQDMVLSMNTNGGIRPANWWKELAKTIGPNGYVTFSIDGLKDTNHIYRRHVKWETIMRNVTAFIEAGGKAQWDFIVFKHNEHQVEEARQMAMDMGFSLFEPKKTGRFFYRSSESFVNSTPIKDKGGNVIGKIERPSETWQNKALLTDLGEIKQDYGSFNNYLDRSGISCKVKNKESVYVNADGLVFPCCWTAAVGTYNPLNDNQKKQMVAMIAETGGIEALNALKTDINDIIEGEFFKAVVESWNLDSINNGKLAICARICGTKFDQYGKQKNN